MQYEYQPGDSYKIHVTEQISRTFCEIVSTKIVTIKLRTLLELFTLFYVFNHSGIPFPPINSIDDHISFNTDVIL